MAHKIALFNHKGGVSKTTTTFNLGWILAEMDKRVVLVDADPQCNLTGMVLGYRGPTELQTFYEQHADQNLMAALAPAFESKPKPIEPVECLLVEGRPGLFLLPGHLRIAEYEVTLGIAQELSGSIQTLKNLPGSIPFLLDATAERFAADYVLIDMSPGLGAINQNLLATSDSFIVPTNPDFFSVMAIDSLAQVLSRWQKWALRAYKLPVLAEADYPFPQPHSKFLGTVVQKYRPRAGVPAAAFSLWIEEIHTKVRTHLIPELDGVGMLLPSEIYQGAGVSDSCSLATIADFNSLIAKSQKVQTPIFALTAQQLGQAGKVLKITEASRDRFRAAFLSLAEKIIYLTNALVSV